MKKKNKKISTRSKNLCIFASQLLWIIMRLRKREKNMRTVHLNGCKSLAFNIV